MFPKMFFLFWPLSLAIFLAIFPVANCIETTNGNEITVIGEEDEPPSVENAILRQLSRKEKKEILRIIGNGTENGQSRAEIEASIREFLARNNSNGALNAFDKWMDQMRDWRHRQFLKILANFSDNEAKKLLEQIWSVLNDTKLSLVESCRRVNELLGKKLNEDEKCKRLISGAEIGLVEDENEEGNGKNEKSKKVKKEEEEEEKEAEIFDGNEFNELFHNEAEAPGSRQEGEG